MGYQPLENYGIIGDLRTAALVGMNGSVDFLCFPRFDSPTIFAALLDDERGGRFQISPVLGDARQKQLYLPDSNILLSRFLSPGGVAEVSDFMPVHAGESPTLIRRAKAVRGEVRFQLVCAPRFDYGRAPHRAEPNGRDVFFHSDGPRSIVLRLRSDVPPHLVNGDAVAEFTLRAGEAAAFILEAPETRRRSLSDVPEYVPRAFKETLNFWRRWIARSTYQGRWQDMINRSALTLKLLTYHPTGAMVAAPTFGLPEVIGGERNWDYRYTWIRDASFSLYALIRLGYTEEAGAFMR